MLARNPGFPAPPIKPIACPREVKYMKYSEKNLRPPFRFKKGSTLSSKYHVVVQATTVAQSEPGLIMVIFRSLATDYKKTISSKRTA